MMFERIEFGKIRFYLVLAAKDNRFDDGELKMNGNMETIP